MTTLDDIQDNEQVLLKENIIALEEDDIALVSYPGCGSSLLGGMLIGLGVDYIEGYQERILPGQKKTTVEIPYWRDHWPQLAGKYEAGMIDEASVRTIKAHCYPHSFANSRVKKAILLVRDPRDAALSYYHWRKGFSDETGSLQEFLERDGYYNKKPFSDWASYIEEWMEWGKEHSLYMVRYEDLKFMPVVTLQKLMVFIGRACDFEEVRRSVEQSSFTKVQKEEKSRLGYNVSHNIFRKGLVGEWLLTLDVRALATMQDDCKRCMDSIGYSVAPAQKRDGAVSIIDMDSVGDEALYCELAGVTDNVNVMKGTFYIEDMDRRLGRTCHIISAAPEVIRAVEQRCLHNGWAFYNHMPLGKAS